MERVIVLNADYSYLNSISWKKAMLLLEKRKVEVVKYSQRIIKTVCNSFKVPLVIKLIKYIRILYRTRVPFSKKNIFARDGFKCAYCGRKTEQLTVDHIVPKSKGGKSTFDNCVAACRPCNNRKGDKTCSEAKMYPKVRPYTPTISEFLQIKMKKMGIDKIIESL
jgi:5-methylcytosine-specific restriction endonuclease McrA